MWCSSVAVAGATPNVPLETVTSSSGDHKWFVDASKPLPHRWSWGTLHSDLLSGCNQMHMFAECSSVVIVLDCLLLFPWLIS